MRLSSFLSRFAIYCTALCLVLLSKPYLAQASTDKPVVSADRPNIVFILTDDHRWDSYNAPGISRVNTPNLDSIATAGTRFDNAFVTLAICSPSRAACLTGRYGSANGVTAYGNVPLNDGEVTFANALRGTGYATGVAGKWHLKTTPKECGFDFASTCWSNGSWYNRKFNIDGKSKKMKGFVDDVAADESIRFINEAVKAKKPFVLWMCTQVPHMDNKHTWPAKREYLDRYDVNEMPVPVSWNETLSDKPEYLKSARNRTRALEYGYDDPANIQIHSRDYRASVEQMDAAVGCVLDELKRKQLQDNTWIIFMGDNGWLLGEHGMTSKVLPYEESMRIPMAIAGPGTSSQVSRDIVLNIDLTATIYELAGLDVPKNCHGRSLLPILQGDPPKDWRTSFLYEAPESQLGSQPLWAVRNEKWKYIETKTGQSSTDPFVELYDLQSDSVELNNLASDPAHRETVDLLATELSNHKQALSAPQPISTIRKPKLEDTRSNSVSSATKPKAPRTDIHISGVYPHLTTYGVYSQNGAHYKKNHNECGIGAVVPWAGKLWMVNYAPHQPRGSEHKLFSVSPDLTKPMTVHPESVGGTPAGRMLHAESKQLLIAHHLIDEQGNVRTISPKDMPIRVTAITRHLKDPANMVYYIDMEGSIWEANVHTLAVKRLFKKPVPGWHGKGGYVSQGRLVISNNGEHAVGDYDDLKAGGEATSPEERGVLAEFDGTDWKIVERRQYTEVTGPTGITGGSDGNDPIWSMGWDRRSVRLKVLDKGKWHTYLLPKAAYCNDAKHGWYTEWPRIREITDGRWMMDMHGMFFDFPRTFSSTNSAGIKPIGSHLRYVPDFCAWNDRLVLATDETSIQGNPLAGQPQSNLWFGDYEDLKGWGPASGYGGPWIEDKVTANTPSDPFLISGFDRRFLHLALGKLEADTEVLRTTDQLPIKTLPESLAALPRVTIPRGKWRNPASGFEFKIADAAKVYVAVDGRSDLSLSSDWKLTDLTLSWGKNVTDRIYVREFSRGLVKVPGNLAEHKDGAFCVPNMAFVKIENATSDSISTIKKSNVTFPATQTEQAGNNKNPVRIQLQVDRKGDGNWTDWESVELEYGGYFGKSLPESLDAVWLRLVADHDCVATAFLHQTTKRFVDGNIAENQALFAGLANVDSESVLASRLYPAKRNRNLRVITGESRYFDFTKSDFAFESTKSDAELDEKIKIEPEFSVDEASVIIEYQGRRFRLPKGDSRYDKPFTSGWPRACREVESERHLANIHGTFYELPLITNGTPPAWNLIRPVSSHSKQITDFCSWNGLIVLGGVRANAESNRHIFRSKEQDAALWFGGIDDLWKLGKPTGHGGPWLNTDVTKGMPSDPYLMKGYDEKAVRISHSSEQPATIVLQVDLDGTGLWVDYKSFEVAPGSIVTHKFASDFSASWTRAYSNRDAQVTVQFDYR